MEHAALVCVGIALCHWELSGQSLKHTVREMFALLRPSDCDATHQKCIETEMDRVRVANRKLGTSIAVHVLLLLLLHGVMRCFSSPSVWSFGQLGLVVAVYCNDLQVANGKRDLSVEHVKVINLGLRIATSCFAMTFDPKARNLRGISLRDLQSAMTWISMRSGVVDRTMVRRPSKRNVLVVLAAINEVSSKMQLLPGSSLLGQIHSFGDGVPRWQMCSSPCQLVDLGSISLEALDWRSTAVHCCLLASLRMGTHLMHEPFGTELGVELLVEVGGLTGKGWGLWPMWSRA
eukprot:Skav204883  [mRNA]  locus=scaffold2602:171555:176696:+ [translate_table: standard]